MLSSYHLTETRLLEYLAAMERFRPDLLHAYPSAALQLAEYLERTGQTWRLPLRALLCGSERLTLPQKRLLERVFKCRVYRWYSHAERVVLAGEGRKALQGHPAEALAHKLMHGSDLTATEDHAEARTELRNLLQRMLIEQLKAEETVAIAAASDNPAALERYRELQARRRALETGPTTTEYVCNGRRNSAPALNFQLWRV